jgi:glutaconyl-CoA decarboxylase
MRPYFDKMIALGKPLSSRQKEMTKENVAWISAIEAEVAEAVEAVKNAGIPAEVIKRRGQMTVWERIEYLVDPGTWCPLHTLYNHRRD